MRRIVLVGAAACVIAACSSPSRSAEPNSTPQATTAATTAAPVAVTPSKATTLNAAVGFGLLRVMTLEERPGARDVVIYPALPNELPRVAGVITTVPQTPLSHVNLRAVQDKIPNAFVADALADQGIAALVGRYVRYTATADGITLAPATQAEVEAHHASSRPHATQTPERNLSVRAITPLSQVRFGDWTAFGVKAANVATLATVGLPPGTVPDGYAVPFYFYDEFMKANGFYDSVRKLLENESFRNDPAVQERQLESLRSAIKAAPMPAWMNDQLSAVQKALPAGAGIRCRSSTNNEDLPNFSGAGLYDSKTQRPDEGHLSKCIKQVFASVWNLRAFLERDFYRIDHLATAMGVLLHPNYDDEAINGVAVSADPVYTTPGAYYVNAQLGEDLVTNPDELSIPESLLLYADGTHGLLSRSNRIEPGTVLLNDDQRTALRRSLTMIHEKFKALYQPAPGENFAMEIEFKFTKDGALAIKQARTWVFN